MPTVDFSNPEQVEKAFTAISEDVQKVKQDAEEEKEKSDSIKKALTDPKIAKFLAKVAEEDDDIKKAMEEDDDIKNAMKKAMEEPDEDDKNKTETATDEDEDTKEVVAEFKAKLINELVASQKAFGATENQIKNYQSNLEAKSYRDVKTEHENYEVQRNFIAKSQGVKEPKESQPLLPFNASYSDSQPEGVYI